MYNTKQTAPNTYPSTSGACSSGPCPSLSRPERAGIPPAASGTRPAVQNNQSHRGTESVNNGMPSQSMMAFHTCPKTKSSWHSRQRTRAAKFIMLNAEFLVFDAQILVVNAKFIILLTAGGGCWRVSACNQTESYQSPACIQRERERDLSIAGMYLQSRQHPTCTDPAAFEVISFVQLLQV